MKPLLTAMGGIGRDVPYTVPIVAPTRPPALGISSARYPCSAPCRQSTYSNGGMTQANQRGR